jgi:hypothetical protein
MKVLNVTKYGFSAVGVGMLIGAFFLYRNTSAFLVEAIAVQGTVVELVPVRSDDSYTYKPVVRFSTEKGEDIEFASSSSSNPPSYREGELVKVFYRAGEPENAKIDGFFSLWGGALILSILGAIFATIGGSFFAVIAIKSRRDAYLKVHGTPVQSEFQSVEQNTSLTVNGRHPFRIVSQWLNPSTNKVHVFRSANIWFDPTSFVEVKHITVMIDQSNPQKYFMDLSFLPEAAE